MPRAVDGDLATLRELGIERSALRDDLAGIEERMVKLARRLHDAGVSVVAIAETCGAHRVTVHRWLRG